MKDRDGTTAQLLGELTALRERVAELEASELERKQTEDALRQARDKNELRVRDRIAELETVNQALQREVAESAHTEEALRRRAQELAALQTTVLEITAPHDLPTLLKTIVERAALLLNASSGGLYLCDPTRRQVHCVVSYNTPHDYTGIVLKYGEGAAGAVAQTGQPLIIDDYRAWSGRASVYENEQPFSAVLSVPMMWQGQVTGVIHVLHNVASRRFTQADLDLLTSFASHAAIAVENARLYETVQQELTERKRADHVQSAIYRISEATQATRNLDELYASIHAIIGELMPAKNFYISLYDASTDLFTVPYLADEFDTYWPPYKPGKGPGAYVLRTGKPLLATPEVFEQLEQSGQAEILYRRMVDWLGVPLTLGAQHRTIGVMAVQTYAEGPRLGEADKDILVYVSNQVAMAIERKRAEEALHESEQKFRAIIEQLSEGFALVDQDGKIIEWNRANEKLSGLKRSEMLGTFFWDGQFRLMLPERQTPERYQDLKEMMLEAVRTGQSFIFERPLEATVRGPDGKPRFIEQTAFLIKDQKGHHIGAITRDVTERKQAEIEIRQRNQELESVSKILGATTTLLDLDTILQRALQGALELTGTESGTICLLDSEQRALDLSAAHNLSREMKQDLGARAIKVGECLCGQVAQTGEPFILWDNASSSQYATRQAVRAEGIRFHAAFPLQARGETIGVLCIFSRSKARPTPRSLQLVQDLCGPIALSIENARLYQAEREQRELAETLREASAALVSTLDLDVVLDRILEQVSRVVLNDAATIMLIEGGQARFARWRGYERFGTANLPPFVFSLTETPNLQRMIQTGEPVIIPDTHTDPDWIHVPGLTWPRSYAGAPIQARGQIIGFLDVNAAQPNFYRPRDAQRLGMFADQVAIALDNARLYQAEYQQRLLAETLRQVSAALATTLDVDLVLDRILEQVWRVVPHDTASIMLVEGGRVRTTRWRGYEQFGADAFVASFSAPIAEMSGLAQMLKTGAPIAIPNTYDEPSWTHHAETSWIRSYAGAPIRVRGETVGFLNVDSVTPGFFQQEHAERLRAFADQAGLALENARLFSMLSQEKRQLEFLYHLSGQLAASLDIQEVSQRALDDLRALSGVLIGLVAVLEHPIAEEGSTEQRDSLRLAAISGYDAESVSALNERLRLKVGDGLIGWVATHRQIAIVDDVTQDARWMIVPGMDEWVRSALSVPLISSEELVGVLSVYSEQAAFFTEGLCRLVESAAATMAVAIANARLYAAERQRAAALAEALEKQRELDRLQREFMQNVSHELRTPLALIRGHAELLEGGDLGELQPEQLSSIGVIVRRTRMLSKLVDDIVSVLGIEQQALERKLVDLGELVRTSVADFQTAMHHAGLVLQAEIAPNVPKVRGDLTALRRALDNLVGNALKFTPAGGSITVRLWNEQDRVALAVQDTGIGIPSDKVGRIFERFYQVDGSTTRRYGGVGLGLALVQEIVQVHQGQITVESQVGAGTTFTIRLNAEP